MDESGTIVEIEQQIETGRVPAAAIKGLKREAGGASILHVESVTRGDKVSYEAEVIQRNGQKREISVNSDGSAMREH